MYALGLTARRIRGRLKGIYAVDVPPEPISRVTDEAKELAGGWSGRPLERVYPAPSLDVRR
jgi:transposase-like protein